MQVDNSVRKQMMLNAWALYRAGGYQFFGLALKVSWARERKTQAYARKLMVRAMANGGLLVFDDVTSSPIKRSLRGQAHAGHKAYRAAYTTAVFGR